MRKFQAKDLGAALNTFQFLRIKQPFAYTGIKYLTDQNDGWWKGTVTKPRNPKGAVYKIDLG